MLQQAAALQELERRIQANPLKYHPQHLKQLEATYSDKPIRVLFWGNRVGKTQWGAMEVARYVQGYAHTQVKVMNGQKKVMPFTVPHKDIKLPIEIWCACPSYDQQKETTQKKLEQYIPKQLIKHITYVKSGVWGEVLLQDGTRINFKSYEQGREKFQGAGKRLIWFDEEPPKDIWDECFVRMEAGIPLDIILTMTPVNGMCFDEETKLLSKQGWVGIDDLEEGDLIYTINKQTKELELKPVDFVYRDRADKPMIRMTNQGFDSLTTEDHRWFVKNKATSQYEVRITKDLKTHHAIPRTFENNYNPKETHADWFVGLMGWVVTDGTYRRDRSQVVITQSVTKNPEKCRIIETLLAQSGAEVRIDNVSYHKGEPCEGQARNYCIKGDLAKRIIHDFPDKMLTGNFISELSKEQQNILFTNLILGDGSHNSNGYRFVVEKKYYQSVEAMMMLCQLLGKRCTYSLEKEKYYRMHIQDSEWYKPFTHVDTLNRREEEYEGRIWCPHTENETVIAMRNGTSYVSMNTWVYDDLYLDTSNTDLFVSEAEWDDNPFLGEKQKEQMMRGLSLQAIEVRRKGKFMKKTGLVCNWFQRDVHIGDITYNEDWDVGGAIDFGFSNPCCFGLIGADYDDDLNLFDGFYETGLTTPHIAERIDKICAPYGINPKNILIIGDSAQAESIQALNDMGYNVIGIKKRSGTSSQNWDEYRAEKMHQYGQVVDGKAKLKVSRNLMYYDEKTGNDYNWFAKEAGSLKWSEVASAVGKDKQQGDTWDPRFANHSIDMLSYYIIDHLEAPARPTPAKPWEGKIKGTYVEPSIPEDDNNVWATQDDEGRYTIDESDYM